MPAPTVALGSAEGEPVVEAQGEEETEAGVEALGAPVAVPAAGVALPLPPVVVALGAPEAVPFDGEGALVALPHAVGAPLPLCVTLSLSENVGVESAVALDVGEALSEGKADPLAHVLPVFVKEAVGTPLGEAAGLRLE